MADSKIAKSAPRNVAEAEAQWHREQAQRHPGADLNPASVFARRKAQVEQAQGARQPSATGGPKATVGSFEYANAVYARREDQVRKLAMEGTTP